MSAPSDDAPAGCGGDEMAAPAAAGRARRPGPVVCAWLVAVGVDLFLNAGLLTGLYDQSREPGLLADEVLFARIPVAYLVVAVGVTAVAWAVDATNVTGARRGLVAGAAIGLVFGLTGVVWLWTAIEVTGAFVGAGILVQVAQMAAAGTVLGAARSGLSPGQLRWRCGGAALVLAFAAVLVQNLIG